MTFALDMRKLVITFWLIVTVLHVGLVAGYAEVQRVSFWTQMSQNQTLLQILKEFSQETGIEVDVKAIGWGTEELMVAMAGGAPPDLFSHGNAAMGAFADYVIPLDDAIANWSFLHDMVPAVRNICVYQGKTLGISWSGVDVRDLVYRVDAFNDTGLNVDQPPRNWKELADQAKKLTRYDDRGGITRSGLALSKAGFSAQQMFSMFHGQLGGTMFVGNRPAVDDQSAIQALEFFVSLLHDHQVDALGFGGSLTAGTTAMSWSNWGAVSGALELGIEVRVAVFPYEKQPATFLGANFAAVSKGAKNEAGALRLLEYLARPETQRVLNEASGGSVPAYRGAARWEWVKASPTVMHFMQATSYGVPNPAHPRWFDIRTELASAVERALKREQTPAALLQQANERIHRMVNE